MTSPIYVGDTEPALTFTIGDKRLSADFSGLAPEQVRVKCYLNKHVLLDGVATALTPSVDGKTCVVVRDWNAGETIYAGRWKVICSVEWTPGVVQSFPPMILDVQNPI